MNRLVIVGNGFDLAHGMKTGYNDFIVWYLKDIFQDAYDKGSYKDDVIHIRADKSYPVAIRNKRGVSDVIDYLYEHNRLTELFTVTYLHDNPNAGTYNPFKVVVYSSLLCRIIEGCSVKSWVQIENDYYFTLKEAIAKDSSENNSNHVAELNKSLTVIISRLQVYLALLPEPTINAKYNQVLGSRIKSSDMVGINWAPAIDPAETMVLNFNYTSTIERYTPENRIKVNYIHGKLNDGMNPLVFGFGDELDDEYKKFELNQTKGIFKYIKSFWYFRTRNYHDLIRFIESDQYQVVILGHSCGLSDRTMLNMIFEDSNCKSVKIYHHVSEGKDNYTEITHEIARHFKNKQDMRKKIVPFDKDSYMPQVY